MFSLVVLVLAVASAGAHSFSPVRRHHVPRTLPPKGWQTGYLEDYNKYHTRYEVRASSLHHLASPRLIIAAGNWVREQARHHIL
jgi:hypothetical protein